jgi:hypothetical protein
MLHDVLIVTNLPFLVAAIVAFNKRFYIWCIMLLVVFLASTAYHSTDHSPTMAIFDRACAVIVVFIITSLALMRSSHLPLSFGFMSGVIGLVFFWHEEAKGYADPAQCLTHSFWHIVAAVTCIIFLASFKKNQLQPLI